MTEVETYPEAFIDQMVAALDNDEGGSFWVQLKHMEANGFDVAWQQSTVGSGILGISESPLYRRELSHEQERTLVLQLRDRMRKELGMVPLTEEQKRTWRYEPLRRRYQTGADPNGPGLSEAEIRKVVDYLRVNRPEVVDYIRSVHEHNAPLGFNGGPNDKYIIRSEWIDSLIIHTTMELVEPDSSRDITANWIEIRDRLLKGEEQ